MAGSNPNRELINWRSLWWLWLGVALVGAFMLWRLLSPLLAKDVDAAYPQSELKPANGFDLSACTVDTQLIEQGTLRRDAIPALSGPDLWQGSAVAGINKEWRRTRHKKAIVVNDQVIGVERGGEARAYPVSVLDWHEVINDTLGGDPIAVTYCPLTASALVFSRRLPGGSTVELGVSGLLYNSNLLMYTKGRPEGGESLLSQLDGRAMCGPLVEEGVRLEQLPAELTLWGDWLERHPQSTIVSLETGWSREYGWDPYGNYYDRGALRFPVEPAPPSDGPPGMERVLAVQLPGGGWNAWTYSGLVQRADGAGSCMMDGLHFTVVEGTAPAIEAEVRVETEGGAVPLSISTLWFGLYAFYPEIELDWQPPAG